MYLLDSQYISRDKVEQIVSVEVLVIVIIMFKRYPSTYC